MSYEGPERRKQPCDVECDAVIKLTKIVSGNGVPGLVQDMSDVRRALWGDEKIQFKGLVENQKLILDFIKPLKPFLDRRVLFVIFGLSIAACVKVLGTELIVDIVGHFIK